MAVFKWAALKAPNFLVSGLTSGVFVTSLENKKEKPKKGWWFITAVQANASHLAQQLVSQRAVIIHTLQNINKAILAS